MTCTLRVTLGSVSSALHLHPLRSSVRGVMTPTSSERVELVVSPLRTRFDLSPKTPTTPSRPTVPSEEEQAPEDFSRDVITKLMRNSMEDLKHAEDTRTKQQVGRLCCSWLSRSLTSAA